MDSDNFLIELAMTSLFFFDNFKLIFNLILFELRFICSTFSFQIYINREVSNFADRNQVFCLFVTRNVNLCVDFDKCF